MTANRFQIFFRILVVSAWTLSLPVMAGELKWQKEPLRDSSSTQSPPLQQIDDLLLKMLACWNAHDIAGNLNAYWNSPQLLVVVNSEQFNGWQQLHDSYFSGYSNRAAMGFIQPKRIQIRLLKPDLALALTWWSISFPNSKRVVEANSTMNIQKFDEGWKIVASHTSSAEL